MKLCRLVIMQDLSGAKLYDSPLMHYLAVRGIDEKAEGFRGPMHYTNILAGVLWMLRLLALEMAIPSRPWPELSIPGKGELGKGKMASVRETLKNFRLAHLVEGSFSPASSILTQLAKGTEGQLCTPSARQHTLVSRQGDGVLCRKTGSPAPDRPNGPCASGGAEEVATYLGI